MAYVESFYLDAKLEMDQETPVEIEKSAEDVMMAELLQGHALDDVAICRVVDSQQKFLEKSGKSGERSEEKSAIVSDYCGFESDEMPPIYRAQMRSIQKKQLIEKEAKEKSQYAYPVENEEVVKGVEKQNVELPDTPIDYYVPGFSPPHQNEEIHKMDDFKLPKAHAICATEHVFNMSVGHKNDASQYIPMPNENGETIDSKMKPPGVGSAVSYTDTGFSTIDASSVFTANLGPAFGCLPSPAPSAMSPAPKSILLADKYKGLSAFRPVSGSIESQYALPDLN